MAVKEKLTKEDTEENVDPLDAVYMEDTVSYTHLLFIYHIIYINDDFI